MINDNIIAATLAASGSVVEVCEKLHISRQTVYNRLRDRAFVELYMQERSVFTRAIENGLEIMLDDALDTLSEIMTDKTAPASVRLQAVRTAFDMYSKTKDMNDRLDRLIIADQEKGDLFLGLFSGSFTDDQEETKPDPVPIEPDQEPDEEPEPVADQEEDDDTSEKIILDPEEVAKAERKQARYEPHES